MPSFSSLLSYVGAALPVVFLGGLLWVTAHLLDTDASHSSRKRTVPGGWDSHYDERIFLSAQPRRGSPSVVRTVSSALTALTPFAQPRSISSTSLIVSCPSPRPIPPPYKKRPSARASSTGVSQTSTSSQTYSRLTSSQYRFPYFGDEAVRKAASQGLLTFEAVDNVHSGRWSLSHAIDRSAKALAAPGRKNPRTATRSAGYQRDGGSRVSPLADDDACASLALSFGSLSLFGAEKKKKKEVSYPVKEDKSAQGMLEVNPAAHIECPAQTTFSLPSTTLPAPVQHSAPIICQPESAPLARAASVSLATKLKFDGFRCGLAPLAAFSRSFQPFQPEQPLPQTSTPRRDAPVEPMELDVQLSPAASTTQSSTTSTSPGFLRKVSQITKQFVNLQIQSSPAPEISPLVGMMTRLSLNDKQQARKAQITQPTSARSRQILQPVKPQTTSISAPPPQAASLTASGQSSTVPARSSVQTSARHERLKAFTQEVNRRRHEAAAKKASSSSSSGQPSSVTATANAAKPEKKQIASASTQPSSLTAPAPLPKISAPATLARPAGQLSLPAAPRPKPKTSSSKPLPQSAAPEQSATSSSSGQSPAPAQASAAKKVTTKLATMGAINPLLANILDSLEAEEDEAKTDKPKSESKPKPKPEPKPEPAATSGEELSFDELESQLAVEQLEMEKEVKKVAKYEGNDRKIAPLRRK